MHINLQNNLPTISLHLGGTQNRHGDIELKVLFTICGALGRDFKSYHDRIRPLYPELVHAYESVNKANPFNTIKFSCAIYNPKDLSQEVTVDLPAIIR
jgi:hypothetical protein